MSASSLRVGAQRPRLELIPDGATSSAADEAIGLASTCGLELHDWQAWALRNMLAERADGSWAAQQSVLLVPRQNGKSELFIVVMLAALFLFGERKIIYSAHLAKTAREIMERLMGLIRANPELEAVTQFYIGNGKESIRRRDTGAVIEFVTRGKRTNRGGSPQRVIFDEALFLTDPQIAALLPGLSAQSMNVDSAPQLMFGSSAPLAESDVLHRLRRNAIAGSLSRTFFAEWSVDVDADFADRANWYAANPMLGVLISEDWVADMEFGTMSRQAFGIERLGVVFDERRPPVIAPGEWQDRRRRDSQLVDPVAFAVEVTSDRSLAVIGVGGVSTLGGCHVEIVDTRLGVDWVVDRLVELSGKWSSVGVGVRGNGEAGNLVPAMERAGLTVHELAGRHWPRACADFVDAVTGKTLVHVGQDNLDAAVAAGVRRELPGGGFEWERRQGSVDVSGLQCVTVARWVATTVQPEPVAAGSGFYFPDLED